VPRLGSWSGVLNPAGVLPLGAAKRRGHCTPIRRATLFSFACDRCDDRGTSPLAHRSRRAVFLVRRYWSVCRTIGVFLVNFFLTRAAEHRQPQNHCWPNHEFCRECLSSLFDTSPRFSTALQALRRSASMVATGGKGSWYRALLRSPLQPPLDRSVHQPENLQAAYSDVRARPRFGSMVQSMNCGHTSARATT